MFKKNFEQSLSRRARRAHAPAGALPPNPRDFLGIGSENHLFIAPKTIPMMAQDETDEGSVGPISVYKCSSAVENPERRHIHRKDSGGWLIRGGHIEIERGDTIFQ